MRSTTFFAFSLRLIPFLAPVVLGGFPEKIHGVNLGSWLVIEPWMLPQEWLDMGGMNNCACQNATCIGSEAAFAQAYPDTVDATMQEHWDSWFNQDDVDALADAGINTVRIPLGYWLVEQLVDEDAGEIFPKGGMKALRRGLEQLNEAGIVAILDHHAVPGAQAVNQQFAGTCTPTPQFYTDYNFHRALIWTAVMTAISHVDPAFESVVSIQAVNEVVMDSSQTPGYGEFQKNFVRTVRAVEVLLGLGLPDSAPAELSASISISVSDSLKVKAKGDFSALLKGIKDMANIFTPEIRSVLIDAFPILVEMNAIQPPFNCEHIITNFMDVSWQWGDAVANPDEAAIGPQAYDNHLYYVFGGVADPNPDAYMRHICSLDRVEKDLAKGNTPLFFGEWGLPVAFNATDEFLRDWADAQKRAYSKGKGWIFWNFKVEKSALAGDLAREWSYLEGVERGYFTKDPAELWNPDVCDPYMVPISSSASAPASASETASVSAPASTSDPAETPEETTTTEQITTTTTITTTAATSSSAVSAPESAESSVADPTDDDATPESSAADPEPTDVVADDSTRRRRSASRFFRF
ncbi:Glycoside hydrolase [Mycena kentingensis (nom. inval.)]|nr:Glycoside hydrolase [Mycena kentingensis (nom. inval.)]